MINGGSFKSSVEKQQYKVDKHLQRTQFGFRARKSTAQALYIARRLQDFAEQTGKTVLFTFLDLEKAFDKVNQSD